MKCIFFRKKNFHFICADYFIKAICFINFTLNIFNHTRNNFLSISNRIDPTFVKSTAFIDFSQPGYNKFSRFYRYTLKHNNHLKLSSILLGMCVF
ncbi:hypothetical protein Henu6_gp84 [Acinetobacter phage Henu6]|uniref:Uncharacterized protein n=1 Tax=Acinetobacter phage Henu6 TaxID=2500136 RepID=A0A410T5B2_9CAUD|nr:hypothetical protein Henu6_gp84 [Acinetobacter phage Henu6]